MSLIKLENVSKHFGAIVALDGVTLAINAGETANLRNPREATG